MQLNSDTMFLLAVSLTHATGDEIGHLLSCAAHVQ